VKIYWKLPLDTPHWSNAEYGRWLKTELADAFDKRQMQKFANALIMWYNLLSYVTSLPAYPIFSPENKDVFPWLRKTSALAHKRLSDLFIYER
jgi:hypothetical protein